MRSADADDAHEWDNVKLSVEESLWLAIRGGAEVVGWPDRFGAFEVGMQFDLQLITFDLVSFKMPLEDMPQSPLGRLELSRERLYLARLDIIASSPCVVRSKVMKIGVSASYGSGVQSHLVTGRSHHGP